jgi:DUF3011 family protein
MKNALGLVLLMAGLVACGSSRAWAQSGITAQNGRNLTCASDDGRRHLCRVDTSRGVQLTNQRSGSPCVQGQTWGYDRQGIWVDRGCRADFFLGGGPGGPGGPGGGTITCSSNNGGRNYCPANVGGGVRLVNQRSGSPCVQGQTWGYDARGIWVDRGCRADFQVGYGGGPSPGIGPGRPGQGVTITCSSNNGQRNYCPANTSRGVQLTNQRSGSPCVQGQTWGFDQRRIWVDRGCRADFLTMMR